MTFLNPLVLFALAAAAIPLIIHLINLRKPRRIEFSSLAFLQELRQQTIRRLRIKQWLLLVIRTLAVVTLVLAFARPTVQSPAIAGLSSEHKSTVVVLDNSLSMELRDQGGSYFLQALDFIRVLAGEMKPSDELVVLPMVDHELPQALGRPALVGAQLDELQTSFGSARLAAALRNAGLALENANNPAREIFVVSDFQTTNFLDSTSVDLAQAGRVVLVPIGEGSAPNVAVTRVQVVSSIIEVNQPTTLAIEVQNFSDQPVRNWGLSVHLEEERVAQSSISLEPGQQGQVAVTVTPRGRGWLRGRVALEDDAFDYDNERFFTLHVPEERRVLLVKGVDRSSGFVELALSTRLRDGSVLFRLDSVEEDAVSGAFSEDYDAVVLLGVRRISPGLATAVTAFVGEGGGVFLFAGEEAAQGGYEDLLRQIGAGSFAGLAEAPEGGVLATLSRLDREHPLFNSVFDAQSGERDVERPSVRKLVRYSAGQGDEQTLLGTSIGLPMLQEVRYDAGRLLIAPFLPDPAWTDLPVRGLFVPLLFRSMYYLTSVDDQSGDGVRMGPGASFRVAGQRAASQLMIVSQTGQEWIPEQRASAQGVFLSVPATLVTPGTYDVMADGRLLQRFAVNLDPLESNLERLETPAAAERVEELAGVTPSILDPGLSETGLSESIRLQETGVEIWNVFLTIALVLLVVEMLVAARWKPTSASAVSSA